MKHTRPYLKIYNKSNKIVDKIDTEINIMQMMNYAKIILKIIL